MALTECPGCYGKMVRGVCSVCGFVAPPSAAEAPVAAPVAPRPAPRPAPPAPRPAVVAEVARESARCASPEVEVAQPVSSIGLIKCPSCEKRISENAAACAGCGCVMTPAIVAVQRNKRDEESRAQFATNAVGMALLSPFVLLFLFLIYMCVSGGSESPSVYVSTDRQNFNSSSIGHSTYSEQATEVFFDPQREFPYTANRNSFHKTRQEAIAALAEQFDRSTAWVEMNMGSSNDLKAIHYNLSKAYLGEGGQTSVSNVSVNKSYQDSSNSVDSKKKKMFFELVAAQDSGVGDERAYSIIAERYGVSDDTVREIAVEGATHNWPMP